MGPPLPVPDSPTPKCEPKGRPASQRLPGELLSLILELTHDWELATTLGIRTTLPKPAPWIEFATPLDRAILRSSTSTVPVEYATTHVHHDHLTQWGARVMLRFGYVHVLDYLARHDAPQLRAQLRQLLPVVASAWGRTTVLEWAQHSLALGGLKPDPKTTAEAIDEASRHGQVKVLDFWRNSGLPLYYSEAALDSATIKRQLGSLEWWKNSGLPLKIGYVLDFASMEGSTVCLDWWADSGLPVRYSKAALYSLSKNGNVRLLDWWQASRFSLVYDKEVLINATRYGQTTVLDWWLHSGLDIEYRFFDIEEALEDSVANKEQTQKWWEHLGYNTSLGANTWMKPRNLRHQAAKAKPLDVPQ
ncbi:uncharacterized protein JCM15063_002027 [Sporobolomyces koalae]|uniref:uncharacterized protein n=1 Tax=Sporobolomyces koalae TaxID=500713 RepID=UPI0031783951